MEFLLYIGIGALAGILSGMLGVGGGLVIVPVLIFSFQAHGFAPSILTQLAVGTSLATIFFTSISSTYSHHRKNSVLWPIVIVLAGGIAMGTVLGVKMMSEMSGAVLQKAIAVFLIVVSIQMWFSLAASTHRTVPNRQWLILVGSVIGWASALFGIGGGSITVPYLTWCNVRIQQAVATSAACGIPIAIFGTLNNVLQGWHHSDLPLWSTGYLYWPALIGISFSSLLTARLGVKLAHRLSPKILRRIFSFLLIGVGARLWVGV